MKFAIKILGLLSFLLVAIGSFAAESEAKIGTEILSVSDQKAKCGFTGRNDCLRVKRVEEENFQIFFQKIERFEFVPGYFYVLEVYAPNAENGSGNNINKNYRLIKILARVEAEKKSRRKASNFFGTHWQLKRIEGKAVNSTRAFIKFDKEKSAAGGNGGCNGFGGDLEKSGSRIKISNVISTKMFCENGSDVENKFLSRLERVSKYEIKNGRLFLMADDKILLEFAAKK